ncbi:MAG: hypothetical protein EP313_01880, partial [Bacteroidetes bacterium]
AKVLISPLSWGYGHAGRMIPLALELQRRGCNVIFAADATLLRMAVKGLPGVTLAEIPGLKISYSRFLPQYLCIFLQLPRMIVSAIRDHGTLRRLAEEIRPDVIISDNRFGFYHREIFSVYVTHQVRIPFPAGLRFLEPLAERIHRNIIKRYDLCLVPDYPGDVNLSGRLSHPGRPRTNVHSTLSGRLSHLAGSPQPVNLVYTGPLSRFASPVTAAGVTPYSSIAAAGDKMLQSGQPDEQSRQSAPEYNPSIPSSPYVCLLLSGPEPQRSLMLEKVVAALGSGKSDLMPAKSPEDPLTDPVTAAGREPEPHSAIYLTVLTATPLSRLPESRIEVQYITAPSSRDMHRFITGASLVIARAGYSSIMELASMGRGAVLIPTPGQPEQEYLGKYLDGLYGFVTLRQSRLERLALLAENLNRNDARHGVDAGTGQHLPDSAPLLENAINLLLENKKK